MITSPETKELMPALLAARALMTPAHKGKRNTHFQYNFANEESWHDSVQPGLAAHGLILTFSVDAYERTGSLSVVRGSARVTHATSAQWLEVSAVGEGQDNADKGAYKAMTGLKKYLYALAFSLPTTDDVEDTAHDRKRAGDEAEAKARASNPAAAQGAVNAARVEAGGAPVIDDAAKSRCKALYERAKLIDKDEARVISKRHGTDYSKIEYELRAFIDAHPILPEAKP